MLWGQNWQEVEKPIDSAMSLSDHFLPVDIKHRIISSAETACMRKCQVRQAGFCISFPAMISPFPNLQPSPQAPREQVVTCFPCAAGSLVACSPLTHGQTVVLWWHLGTLGSAPPVPLNFFARAGRETHSGAQSEWRKLMQGGCGTSQAGKPTSSE